MRTADYAKFLNVTLSSSAACWILHAGPVAHLKCDLVARAKTYRIGGSSMKLYLLAIAIIRFRGCIGMFDHDSRDSFLFFSINLFWQCSIRVAMSGNEETRSRSCFRLAAGERIRIISSLLPRIWYLERTILSLPSRVPAQAFPASSQIAGKSNSANCLLSTLL